MQVHFHATFPGLKLTRLDFLFTHGISPSVAVATAIAEDPGPGVGTLVFYESSTVLMEFRDCAIDQATITPPMASRGHRMRINILDRRWKWQYPLISGRYNVRKSDCTIREDTRKTYTELIRLVLDEMGEKDYVIEVPEPNLEAPAVEWYRQRADLQLAWLCDRIGCLIVLGLDNVVHIVPNGSGPLYPSNGLELDPLVDTTPATRPQEVRATYAPTRFQMKVRLEAVGLNTDGSIYPINWLEYTPEEGWDSQVPGVFNDVTADSDRQLARDTVYRWYRVWELLPEGLELPIDENTVSEIDNILPLFPHLLQPTDDNRAQPAYIEGYFFNGDLKGINEEEGDMDAKTGFARWDDQFQLDCERGIVKFPYPVYYVDPDGHQSEADLYLTCSFCVRELPTDGFIEHEVSYYLASQPNTGYGYDQVEQADVYRCVIQEYEDEEATSVIDNQQLLDEQGLLLARSYAKHHEAVPQAAMQWNGIVVYPINGNVHQMRWRLGGGPAITWGGKNVAYNYMSPSYQETKLRREVSRSLHL